MNLKFNPMSAAVAQQLVAWQYDPPYDIYDVVSDDVQAEIQYYADPQNDYYSIETELGELVAFCCFGNEGQVPGGDYGAEALDVGVGMRPDLTGKGKGTELVQAILRFAGTRFKPYAFRVTIAEINKRSRRVFDKIGFQPMQSFTKSGTNRRFVVLIKAYD